MPCYHPVTAYRTPHGVVFSELRRYDITGTIQLPCGQCIGCRLRRAQDWAIRIMHEAHFYKRTSFITLTYDDEHLPNGGNLQHRDFQLFMKRTREHLTIRNGERPDLKYFVAGEYGPTTQRPHYHACIFGYDFRNDRKPAGKSASGNLFYKSEELNKLWQYGTTNSVQDLTPETAAYSARYIVDKLTGDLAVPNRIPEYSKCSKGIGQRWFNQYQQDVYRTDSTIQKGKEFPPPKYYDKLKRRMKEQSFDQTEYERYLRGKNNLQDQTDERLATREYVKKAQIRNQKRGN